MRASLQADRDRRHALRTSTGRLVWPLEPRVEDIAIGDIARALSQVCRFGGHTDQFYSVAQHSVSVSLAVPREIGLWALLHDASEAYLGDVPSPIKYTETFAAYREAEARLQTLIFETFGLFGSMPDAVKEADRRLLAAEIRDLTAAMDYDAWAARAQAWPVIVPLQPRHAERAFMRRFHSLLESAVASPQADGVPS